MVAVRIFVLYSIVLDAVSGNIYLEGDRPSVRVQRSDTATLQCCYSTDRSDVNYAWIGNIHNINGTKYPYIVNVTSHRVERNEMHTPAGVRCHVLIIRDVQPGDSGLYQCHLNSTATPKVSALTHGTFLQVYKPVENFLNISESTKNKILVAEGITLFLTSLLPGIFLLCKMMSLNHLENKKKVQRETENIYEGLILGDCSTPYDQIHRSQCEGTYQDVCNVKDEGEEEIQVEKP